VRVKVLLALLCISLPWTSLRAATLQVSGDFEPQSPLVPYIDYRDKTYTIVYGLAGRLDTGNGPVILTQFGIYGAGTKDGAVGRWVVFKEGQTQSPVYWSEEVLINASDPQWLDSPALRLNLAPNTTYWLALSTASRNGSHFRGYGVKEGATALSGGGVTLPGDAEGDNIRAIAHAYFDPRLAIYLDRAQQLAFRVTVIPEPGLALLIAGPALWGLGRRRGRETS
jgi:hypothetical protein